MLFYALLRRGSGQVEAMKIIAITLLFAFSVNAAELRWCLDNFPRYHEFKAGQRQPEGPSVQLMQHLAEAANFKLVIMPKTPPKRCFQLIAAGDADVMTNLLHKPERAEIMTLLPTGAKRRDSFIVKYDEKRDFSDASRLRHASVITVLGYHYEQNFVDFLQVFPKEQLTEVADIQTGLNIISKGRADILVTPSMPGLAVAIENFPPNTFNRIKSPWVLSHQSMVYMGLSKKSVSPELTERVRIALEQAIADGTVHQIFATKAIEEEVARLKDTGGNSGNKPK